jgi:hypothetical protein
MLSRLKHAMTRVPGYKGRYLIVSAVILALLVPSLAVGFGEGKSVLGGKRNPSPNATRSYSQETEIIANTETYGTRQSNKRDGDGGGAIYGCRSNPGREPCVKAFNLKGGRAFEFQTVGDEGGRIEIGGNRTGPPLTTNATGVATGFNADKVDGKEASDFAAKSDVDTLSGSLKFAQVSNGAQLQNGRGATAAALTSDADNTVTVTFDRDVSKCSYTATLNGGAASTDNAVAVGPGSDARTVRVDQPDDPTSPRAFYLQVIC